MFSGARPEGDMSLDEPHFIHSQPIRLVGYFQVGVRLDVEILFIPIDLVIANQAADDIDRRLQRFRLAEIEKERLPFPDLSVGVSSQKVLGMLKRDRPAFEAQGSTQTRNFMPAARAASLTGLSVPWCQLGFGRQSPAMGPQSPSNTE